MISTFVRRSGMRRSASSMLPRSLRAGMTIDSDGRSMSATSGRSVMTCTSARNRKNGRTDSIALIAVPIPIMRHGTATHGLTRTISSPDNRARLRRSVSVTKVMFGSAARNPRAVVSR